MLETRCCCVIIMRCPRSFRRSKGQPECDGTGNDTPAQKVPPELSLRYDLTSTWAASFVTISYTASASRCQGLGRPHQCSVVGCRFTGRQQQRVLEPYPTNMPTMHRPF
jgi:hypothetical protein